MSRLGQITHAFLITVEPGGIPADDPRLSLSTTVTRIVSQFDMRGYSSKDLREICDFEGFTCAYGRPPRAGEVGCAAAHRFCYEALDQEAGDLALVLEDDALVGPGFDDVLQQILRLNLDFGILSLKVTHGVYERRPSAVLPAGEVYRATYAQFGTHAYLIRRSMARQLAANQRPQIRYLADWPVSGPLRLARSRVFGFDSGSVRIRERKSTIAGDATAVQSAKWSANEIWRKLLLKYRLSVLGDRVASPGGGGVASWSA